jgi:hypothetical protein
MKSNQEKPLPAQVKITADEAVNNLNGMNSKVRNIFCPTIRMNLMSESSLFCNKQGDFLLQTWFLGRKEASIACKKDKYWFWIRSFNKDSLYFCDSRNIQETRLRPMMRPEIIRLLCWISEIDPSCKIEKSGHAFVAESKSGQMTILTEFDGEKILSQSVAFKGEKIVTMKGGDYIKSSGPNLPKKIRIDWHEEKRSEEFFIKSWTVNCEDQEISEPEGLLRINLEEIEGSFF